MLNSPFTCMPMVRLLAHWMLALEPLLRAFTTELTRVGELQTDASDPWSHVGVDISSYLGQQIYIQFDYSSSTSSSPSNYQGDIAIDLVQVETCVSSFFALLLLP